MIRLLPRWRRGIALAAIYALMLQALLPALAPLAHVSGIPRDSLAVIICTSFDHSPTQDNAPGAPTDHPNAACCILCPGAGLDVANDDIAEPDYKSSRPSPLIARVEVDAPSATELSPINPRAPPRFV